MKDIPLFEFDYDQLAVVQPDHEHLDITLPEVAVFAFVGEEVDNYAKRMGAPIISEFHSITKKYPIYLIEQDNKQICMCQAPCGAPAAVQIMDWMIHYGVKKIISCGSCGVLEKIEENAFMVPFKAIRDEGTSYHYMEPSRFVTINETMIHHITDFFTSRKIPYSTCITWTTDGFFRETKKKVIERRNEGCSVVEMECAALAACASFRDVLFGQFLFTADSLHQIEEYDERDWGKDSLGPALLLSIEIAFTL